MKQNIHPEYRPVVFMDTTTGYKFLSGSTKASDETVEFQILTHSTLVAKNSLKQMVVWIASTKNTVSQNNKPHFTTEKTNSFKSWFFCYTKDVNLKANVF